ncbi:exonuclease domain-containing protein [Roseovarius sp. S1116L3]|uniref:3'-5' exonuclease n=1 Tax=Roseovarius roseus TaxID=3342636 RepID=UPI003727347D
MKHLSLRIRVFLFFCLAALGSLVILGAALWMGFRQLGDPDALSAFISTGVIAGLGITGLIAFIWLLFDDNVSKPVETIASSLRVRAHVDVSTPIDVSAARYLGDLAPAASALGAVLANVTRSRSEKTDHLLAELTAQRDQLVEILSDIPIATILISADHRIVLYDGQAAAMMERVGAARLKASIFDYLDKTSILTALDQMNDAKVSYLEIAVTTHSGDMYSGHIRTFDTGYTLMLEPLEPSAARPLTYDFDLLTPARAAALRDIPLRDLVYVVFDSETTGLDPAVDEVVQLGAVRVVNGKIVKGEVFDTLVDPGIPIPKRSTDVHGIDNSSVAGAPAFADVCTKFHAFSEGAVFVAHNAAFDMAFLHKEALKTGRKLDQPVLDTVLMSAAIFGGSATHTLDAICERLEICIPPEQRHTAMGDAVATAKALVAMIPILEGRGIRSFGALQAEADKHRRIIQGGT